MNHLVYFNQIHLPVIKIFGRSFSMYFELYRVWIDCDTIGFEINRIRFNEATIRNIILFAWFDISLWKIFHEIQVIFPISSRRMCRVVFWSLLTNCELCFLCFMFDFTIHFDVSVNDYFFVVYFITGLSRLTKKVLMPCNSLLPTSYSKFYCLNIN